MRNPDKMEAMFVEIEEQMKHDQKAFEIASAIIKFVFATMSHFMKMIVIPTACPPPVKKGGEIVHLPDGTKVIPNDISEQMAKSTTLGKDCKVTFSGIDLGKVGEDITETVLYKKDRCKEKHKTDFSFKTRKLTPNEIKKFKEGGWRNDKADT